MKDEFERGCLLSLFVSGVILITTTSTAIEPPIDTSGPGCLSSRVAALIQQLGHDEFIQREEAENLLTEIGEPALPALQFAVRAVADPEIRWRAAHATKRIAARRRETAGRQDLEKLQGAWYTSATSFQGTKTPENRNDTITFEGNRYVQKLDGNLLAAGKITISDATANPKQMEYDASEGPYAGSFFWSIYRVGDRDLVLCSQKGSAAIPARPGTFSDQVGFVRVLKRFEMPIAK